ncbi:MAG: electron transport complex subunit RsxC [Candidatus Omnitrophica bacterium]|nr:electron transport complex subunit RsxC [Candidatus Omnitrophota bacterium]
MVRLEENKFHTQDKPIENAPLPANAYIPISQHIGAPCDNILVKPGDAVLRGQLIAQSEAKVYSPVHSSISGKVTAIRNWPHPSRGMCRTIIIENDGKDLPFSAQADKTKEEAERSTPEQIRGAVFSAGIVGMGGAAFPTHIKLNPPKPIDSLIINIAECEPYLTGDSQLVLEKTQEIINGITLIKNCLNCGKIYVAIEDNKESAIKILEKELKATPYQLRVLRSLYPQGGEKQLIKQILNKELPPGKLPFDLGVNVQNVSTVFAVYESVYRSKPLYERVVTVTGSLLENPKNILARIGTPIKELIAFCGPLRTEPAKMIIGGPMMGIAQYTDQVPVIKSTTGVILLDAQEAKMLEEQPCIRCAACVRNCPMGLMPCLINLSAAKGLWQEAKGYGVLDCIECGLCNFICPSNRRLTQTVKLAKMELSR